MKEINIAQFRKMFLNAKYQFCIPETSKHYIIQSTTNCPFRVVFSCNDDRIIVSGIENIFIDENEEYLRFKTENYLTGTQYTYNFEIIKIS